MIKKTKNKQTNDTSVHESNQWNLLMSYTSWSLLDFIHLEVVGFTEANGRFLHLMTIITKMKPNVWCIESVSFTWIYNQQSTNSFTHQRFEITCDSIKKKKKRYLVYSYFLNDIIPTLRYSWCSRVILVGSFEFLNELLPIVRHQNGRWCQLRALGVS